MMLPSGSTSNERTPLLADAEAASDITYDEAIKHDVYDRFTPAKKRTIVAIVSLSGLIPLFVSGTFIPGIPQIARDLNSTGPVISLAVSLSILVVSLSSLVWATYSGYYGRRPVYLASIPFLAIGSLGVASSNSVAQLMISRIVQAAGASAGMSVGSGVIGDIYRLEERGFVMGIYFAACLLGPALAPFAGGVAAAYYTWRHMQYVLFVSAVLAYIPIVFSLPETSHPGARGVDKVTEDDKNNFVFLNPLDCYWLLRSPNLFAVTIIGTVTLLTDYVLLIPLAYTIGKKYGITNEALIGACFIPAGCGNLLGAPLAGRISDRIVVRWRKRRGGKWVPEDRLRATLIGIFVFVPMSILLSGITTTYVSGTPGIILNLICLFMNGIGVDFVLSPSAAYNVDIMHSKSAEIMAANNSFRGILLAVISTGILPSINAIGVLHTNLISASLAWIGAVLTWLTIRYGERMRAYVDVGFSISAGD